MTPLSFRLADLDDVHVLLALVEAAYRGAPTASTWTTDAPARSSSDAAADARKPEPQ